MERGDRREAKLSGRQTRECLDWKLVIVLALLVLGLLLLVVSLPRLFPTPSVTDVLLQVNKT